MGLRVECPVAVRRHARGAGAGRRRRRSARRLRVGADDAAYRHGGAADRAGLARPGGPRADRAARGRRVCGVARSSTRWPTECTLDAGKPVIGTRCSGRTTSRVVGWTGGKPASGAAVMMVDGHRYVALVATDPAHQRRGYAEAAMRRALDVAAERHGAVPSFLHATDAGRPIYARMGYAPVTSAHDLHGEAIPRRPLIPMQPTRLACVSSRLIRRRVRMLVRATAPVPAAAQPSAPITLAVVNARIWTGDTATPWAEALAVSGEQIVAVGTSDEIRRRAAGVTPIDAGGTAGRARLHRLARALRRRRLPAGVGAAARRAHARRVRQPHQGVCGHGASRHVDHRRRLGPQPVGRRAAARATGSTRRRRITRSGSTGSTGTWRWPTAPR